MDKEIERIVSTGELESVFASKGMADLLQLHNSSAANSEKSLTHVDIGGRLALFESEILLFYGMSAALTCSAAFFADALAGFPLTILGVTSLTLGAGFVGCKYGSKIFNKFYLGHCAKSKDPKKRAYYVNKVLDFMLVNNIDSPVFDDSYVLGYSLWFHEENRTMRSQKLFKKYMKSFSSLNPDDFEKDKNFSSYIDIAKSMIDGEIDREWIPRLPQTESHKRLYEKYPEIIDSRPNDNSYLLMDKEKEREGELEAELVMMPAEYRVEFDNWGEYVDNSIVEIGAAPEKDFSYELVTLERIESEWFETQSDIVQILKFPLFADISDPVVQSFYTKLGIAKSLSRQTLDSDFITAVSNVDTAWNALIYEAQRVKLSKFDDGERKKILMATNLMNIALNSASTPSERQSAYRKAIEQLEGLVVLPESVISVIDQSVSRREIIA